MGEPVSPEPLPSLPFVPPQIDNESDEEVQGPIVIDFGIEPNEDNNIPLIYDGDDDDYDGHSISNEDDEDI